MTDSMKFGPEWLRNMSADSTNPSLLSSGSGASSSGNNNNTSAAPSASTTSSYNVSGTGGHHTFALFGSASGSTSSYTPAPRNTFPEFRYGREEMLSLFDKNYNMPEILPSFKKIFVEKVQYPLALTPSTDEEMLTQGPPVPAQRPSWIQRSPVSFSNSTRGIGRGGSVDRGRMRGKSNYHQIYQRPTAMFEDDVRSIPSLKSDRGWPERNGAGDSLGGGVGSGSVIGGVGSGIGLGSDWNGTPASSPRKEFSSHPRNMENWRRNRNEDGSGDASVSGGGLGNTDGWRIGSGGNGGTSTSFSSTHRWGRSTSWRDEDVPSVAIDGGYGGSSICMQRSYSTITTVNERGGYMNSGGSSGSLSKTMQNSSNYMGGPSSSSNQSFTRISTVNSSASRNHQWSSGSGGNAGGGNSGDGDDNLPEWAMENPSDGGGTFDATGAFHGSVDEDETSTSADGSNEKSHSNGSIGQQRKKSISSSEGSTRSGQDNFKNNESPETATETLTIATGKNKQAESDREAESVSTVTSDSSLTDGKQPLETSPKTFESESDESNLEISVKKIGNAQITESGQTQSQQEIDMEKTSVDVISIAKTPVSTSSVVAISQVSTSNSTYYNSNDSISLLPKSTMHLTSDNSGNGQKEFSDRMQEVADDMIEKLIMDDDTMGDSNSCVEAKAVDASLSTTATANNIRAANTYATPVVAAMLKQSTQHQQTAQNSVSPTLPPTMADAGHPKCMPLYGGGVVVDHATMQQHHHLQQQQLVAAAANLAAAARLPHTAAAPTDLWYYRDPQSKVQGPFTAMEMTEWYRAGYFNENLYVRRLCDTHFRALGELIKLCHDNMPFTHSHLIPVGLDNIHVPSATGARPQKPQILNDFTLKQQSDQREELKGNVTAAADFLSGAVKNLSPVDMSHVLSIHFQMLQDQYIRHQEVIIFNELSKNECFQRLTSSEKEAIVRQKLQHHGLPEYLTSLAGLNNSLATLNPTAGNQLYDAIAECTKKEHIFRNAPGSSSGSSGNAAQQHQQQANTFHDTDHFMINSQQQQLQAQFTSAPYGNILSTVGTDGNAGVGGNKLDRSGDDLTTNELLNNYNLRMFLPGDNTNSSHLTISAPSNANDFLNEQQILAPPTSMVHMWLPPLAGNPTNTTPLQTPLISGQQSQQSSSPAQQQSNQWGNSLMVGFPVSVMTGTQLSSASVGMVQSQPQQKPSSMWDLSALDQVQSQEQQLDHNSVSFDEQNSESALQNAKSKEQTISAPQKQQQRKNVDNVAESQTQMSVGPQVNDPIISASLSSVIPLPTPTKQRKDDPVEKYQQNIGNKRNNSKHQQSSSNKVGVKDDNLNNRKNEEERRRELADEKRRQKEEKKRQLLEDEKRRLQQIEEEKRRQTLEEKERQQQIQAQRRKALLGTNNSPNTSASTTNNNMNNVAFVSVGGTTKKEQQRVQSSVAPWSMQTTAAATKSGPCLAEIQKAERRERRADQQRQMEILEKQIRANAAEANDAMLKWNASPMPVKSLTEIQAEEAKRLANEQLEIQRRKEQEQQAALTIGALGGSNVPVMATGVNSISAIWSGPKVWGSTSTAGFWEEPIKFSAAIAATATNQTTTAAVVAANLGGGNNTGSNSGNNKQAQTIQKTLQVGNASTMSSTNTSTPNVSHQSQGGNTARNLRKSQTVSIMQNTSANNKSTKANQQNSVVSTTKTNGNKQQQQKGVSNDGGGSGAANEKKTSVKIQHKTVASGNNSLVTSKRDDYENEFTTWCTKSLNNMNAKVDVPTFVTFLQDLESPYEVKDYIRMYLGENKEYTEFSKQFLERRSKYKNLQRAQNAHNDDMCKPAPAITPSGNDSSDNKGKQKKIKKNKMTKLDARILGFSVTAAEGRINVGARDYVDAP